MAAYNQNNNNQLQNPYPIPPYSAQGYNNDRSNNEVNVPLTATTDAFENDKPPIYVGEGLLDQKGGYGGGEIQKDGFDDDQKDDRHHHDFERGYGEVQNDGVIPPGPKYFA